MYEHAYDDGEPMVKPSQLLSEIAKRDQEEALERDVRLNRGKSGERLAERLRKGSASA